MIWIAAGFDTAASVGSTMPDSNVFPIFMMLIVVLGSVLLVVRGLFETQESRLFEDGFAAVRVIGLLALLPVALIAWEHLGFLAMSAGFGLACAILLAVRSWWIYAIAIVFGPMAGLVFEVGLGVQL